MCELTFINSHRLDLNRILTINQALENTRIDNLHGWGIFTQKAGIYKTALIPWNTSDFGKDIRSAVTEEPVLLHVRSASRGTDIKMEFNHPFETERLVLAHNGTLVPKDKLEGYAEKLDSEVFLGELDRAYLAEKEDENRLVRSLQSTMEKFTGKFAFLIYEKGTGSWYAIRGKTADLHITYLLSDIEEGAETLGYIINTVKVDLGVSTDHSLELFHVLGKKSVPVMSIIEELKPETIYRLEDTEVKEVGELKQNTAPVIVAAVGVVHQYGKYGYRAGMGYGGAWEDDDDPLSQTSGVINELNDWIITYGLTIEDLDTIMVQTLGISLLCCEEQDITTIQKYVLPKLQCPRKFREAVLRKINQLGSWKMLEVYKKGSFQFPYMLERDKVAFLRAMTLEIKITTPTV